MTLIDTMFQIFDTTFQILKNKKGEDMNESITNLHGRY